MTTFVRAQLVVLLALLVATPTVLAADAPDDQGRAVETCVSATVPDELTTLYVAGPSGQVVTVHSRRSDPEWERAMTQAIGRDLVTLERLTGLAMPHDELTVVQSSGSSRYGLPDDYRPIESCLLVHNAIDTPAVPAVALARTWFNDATVADAWLSEGLALWAGHRIRSMPCPDAAPATAQCRIVETIADRIGSRRMISVVSAFVSGTAVYGDASAPTNDPGPADWRDFIDAVDELGLIRADERDLEWAERLLIEHGAVTAADLEGRAETRTLYHGALDDRSTTLPDEVHALMGEWRFDEARAAILAETGDA